MDQSNQRRKFWRSVIKHRIVEAYGGECACCHQKFNDCCYDVHHLDPAEKELTLSSGNFSGAKSWLRIRDELRKCTLVCANCHRLIHNGIIDNPTQSNFNEDYYEWDLTDYNQIDTATLTPLDTNEEDLICPQCSGIKSPHAKLCLNCSTTNRRQFDVNRDELKQLIRTKPFTHIGQQFGVSDNAIRKRCKVFNLPTKKTEINQYSDEEWDKL